MGGVHGAACMLQSTPMHAASHRHDDRRPTLPPPPQTQSLVESERPAVEKRMEAAVKEGQRFQRVVVSREEALTMFTENKFKVRLCVGGCWSCWCWLF